MNAIALGPLILSGERVAVVLGLLVFLAGSGWLAKRISPRFNTWGTAVVIGGVVIARLAHVIDHHDYFSRDLWRAFAVWQGGFAWPWALLAVAAASLLLLRDRRLIAWAAAPVAAAAMVWTAAYQLASQTEALPPPALVLASLADGPVNLAEAAGRPTVINLWATWCPPCRREMPTLAQAEATHPDVRFLFVNQGEGPDTVRRFLKAEGLELEHVLLDEAMAVPRHYATAGIPVTLFLYADGNLSKAHVGEIAPEQIDAEIRRLDR